MIESSRSSPTESVDEELDRVGPHLLILEDASLSLIGYNWLDLVDNVVVVGLHWHILTGQ